MEAVVLTVGHGFCIFEKQMKLSTSMRKKVLFMTIKEGGLYERNRDANTGDKAQNIPRGGKDGISYGMAC